MVGNEFKIDELGFLSDVNQWNQAWALQVADQLALTLEGIDWQIIEALRQFYFSYDLSPAMRPLVKQIKLTVGEPYGTSMWLMQRYGESPARSLAQLAGLPKPKNCL